MTLILTLDDLINPYRYEEILAKTFKPRKTPIFKPHFQRLLWCLTTENYLVNNHMITTGMSGTFHHHHQHIMSKKRKNEITQLQKYYRFVD